VRPSNGPPESGKLPLPTTWLFDPDSFTPASKIVGDKYYSIITDHLGTPLSMYDDKGVQSWAAELDIYGTVKNLQGEKSDCPFRFPGQYEDCETGLYYNRFRYYDYDSGEYVSQDPIGLVGGLGIYSYVRCVTTYIDIFGLASNPWLPHGAGQNDIIGKGLHFNAGDKFGTELKVIVDKAVKLKFIQAFSTDVVDQVKKAVKMAEEKFLTDSNWRKRLGIGWKCNTSRVG